MLKRQITGYMTGCARMWAVLLAMMLMTTSCDDKHEYVAAEPDSEDCMGVYFAEDNEQDFIFIPGEGAEIHITLLREKADVAADVPLICTSTVDGVVCPSTAHFDSGSRQTSFTIDCNKMPVKTIGVIKVDLPDEYINHYAQTLFDYQTTALVSEWVPANADGSPVTFYFTENDYINSIRPNPVQSCYKPIECDMYVLPGAGLIRIDNFLNTGIDMKFKLTLSPYADYLGFYRISPCNNYMTMNEVYESDAYGDSWFNPWFVMTDPDEEGEEDFAEARLTDLNGAESALDYPRLYLNSESYAFEYSYAHLKSASFPHSCASMGLWGMPADESIVIPSYFYLYFRWDGETSM